MHVCWIHRVHGDTYGGGLKYVRWDGTNWEQADGTSQTIAITDVNAEEIESFTVATDKADWRPAIYSDSSGQPHIIYKMADGSGYIQLYHRYHNGISWSSAVAITSNATYTDSQIGGASPDPFLLIDRDDDTLYVYYNGLGDGMGIIYRYSNDYTNWFKSTVSRASVGRNHAVCFLPAWESNKNIAVPIFPFGSVVNLGNDPDGIARLFETAPAPPRMTAMGGFAVPVPTG